jgi:hypothetical protein
VSSISGAVVDAAAAAAAAAVAVAIATLFGFLDMTTPIMILKKSSFVKTHKRKAQRVMCSGMNPVTSNDDNDIK